MIKYIASGDTIPTRSRFTAVVDNIQQDMTAGWTCQSSVLLAKDRSTIVNQRPITEMVLDAGQNYFQGMLTSAESNLLVTPAGELTTYIWVVQVTHAGNDYSEEIETTLVVRSPGIT